MVRAVLVVLTLILASPIDAKPLTVEQNRAIDAVVGRILKASEVPSASIAIVTDGQLDYSRAYGDQRFNGTAATTTARYKPKSLRGGLTSERYILSFADRKLLCVVRAEPSTGRIEQLSLYPFSE